MPRSSRLAALVCSGVLLVLSALSTAQAAPVVHVVRRGDSLSAIAARYHVSQARIREWNDLTTSRILVGQRLELWPTDPGATEYVVRRGDSLSAIAVSFGVKVDDLKQLNGLRTDQIRVGQRLRLRPDSSTRHHVVRRGDNLSELALRYGTTVARIKTLNHLRGDTIRPGQKLTVNTPADDDEAPLVYVVRPGDTLSQIAQRHEVGLRLLRRLNGLQGDVIRPGQKLQLRPSALEEGVHVVQAGETLSGIAGRYQIKLSELRQINDITGSRILVGEKLRLRSTPRATHIVERGDALWEIARAYGTTVAELKELNGLTSNRIYPGQELALNVTRAEQYGEYLVKTGDYLGHIARLHQMSVAELRSLNGLAGSVIHPGDRLKVRPFLGRNWLKPSEIDWDSLKLSLSGARRIAAGNGPYYYSAPKAGQQRSKTYYEGHPSSPLTMYRRGSTLWKAFEQRVGQLGRLSNSLDGWRIVLDPGHGGLDPGAVAAAIDGNGNKLYVTEDEYVYDVALRVYVLLRLHGARVWTTLLSPNHLIRQSSPTTATFVNEKNEVYNSYEHNKSNRRDDWPSGGNLNTRVRIARKALAGAPRGRRIFLSFHGDIDSRAPEAPLVLYYTSRSGKRRDLASRGFARSLLPLLGAGARTRGQALGVLRDNPADYKVLFELRNMAYRDHVWALRFEELRQRDAEKVVQGILEFARERNLSARR
jgi:LysM repeat protein